MINNNDVVIVMLPGDAMFTLSGQKYDSSETNEFSISIPAPSFLTTTASEMTIPEGGVMTMASAGLSPVGDEEGGASVRRTEVAAGRPVAVVVVVTIAAGALFFFVRPLRMFHLLCVFVFSLIPSFSFVA